MNSNQINASGNGSIVAISLAVITSVTTVVTTIVNKEDNADKKPEIVATTSVTPTVTPTVIPTVHSLQTEVDSLTKKLNDLEGKIEKYKNFNNNALFDIVSLLDLDEKTRSDFYYKLRAKMLLAENQYEFESLNSFKDVFLSRLKFKK